VSAQIAMRGYSCSQVIRKAVLLALAALAVGRVAQDSGPRLLESDFVPYWVSARLLLSGANPYSASDVFQLQAQLHLSTRPRPWRMWNPPTALTVVVPFGLLPLPVSARVWFFFDFATVFVSSLWLWRIYRGPAPFRWMSIVLPAIFVPVGVVLIDCQITPLLLVGSVAFLHFIETGSYAWAGAALALIALKPQLCLPLVCALVLWCARERRWQVLSGWMAGTAILLVPVCLHRDLVSEYLAILPRIWDDAAPAWGGLLRAIFGYERTWLQYLPVIAGLLWTVWYWRKNRTQWNWRECLPMVLLVGFITAPYAWTYDEVILLPAILSAAVYVLDQRNGRLATWSLGFYLLLNTTLFILNLMGFPDRWYIWNVPVFLLAYMLLMRNRERITFGSPAAEPRVAHP
jgi:hypothetical protein